jgi:signal transduction histidine kinase
MMRLPTRPASFRTSFLLVVLFAAVVPLVLIGVWLTRSVVDAGEDLLRSELEQSLEKISASVAERWSYRRGDLELLVKNEAASRLLAAGLSGAPAPDDAEYLAQLFASVSPAIPAFEYRDAKGDVRWASPAPAADTTETRSQGQDIAFSLASPADAIGTNGQRRSSPPSAPAMTVRLPVDTGTSGAVRLGDVIARLSLAALMPIDSPVRLPNGARLQWVQRSTGQSLLPPFAPDSLLGRDRFTTTDVDWIAVRRSMADPEVDLILAAPLDAYVQPFERVARTGVITLAVVALLALMLSGFLTTRLTSSLERLAVAADAVASGDLAHRVDGRGAAEVGRVAAAFNSMTESLQRTLAELSKRQALAAAGEFAVSLSHEVRNGLTAVRVDLQRAEEKTGEGAPGRPLIARALENVKRLEGTVSGSLRVARSGRNPHRRLDLGPVAAAAAGSAESTFAERGATLSPLTSAGATPWVLGDAVALEQLFLNLLLNSAQAMAPGGRASLTVDIDGADVRVVVADTGTGIVAQDLERVVEPFFSTKADGTGLGLPIARQIAAAHGGSLTIESVAGNGTRIEVRLPLAAAPV